MNLLFEMTMGMQVLKVLGIIAIFIAVGIVLAIIGIQHEYIVKLNVKKTELEIVLKDLEKKNEELKKKNIELETELSKYDKKRKKFEKKEKAKQMEENNTNTE